LTEEMICDKYVDENPEIRISVKEEGKIGNKMKEVMSLKGK